MEPKAMLSLEVCKLYNKEKNILRGVQIQQMYHIISSKHLLEYKKQAVIYRPCPFLEISIHFYNI